MSKVEICLSPGKAAWYDELSKVHLTVASPYAVLREGTIVTNIKKGLKTRNIFLTNGTVEDLDSDKYIDPRKEKMEIINEKIKSGKASIEVFFGEIPGGKKTIEIDKDEDNDKPTVEIPTEPEEKPEPKPEPEEKPKPKPEPEPEAEINNDEVFVKKDEIKEKANRVRSINGIKETYEEIENNKEELEKAEVLSEVYDHVDAKAMEIIIKEKDKAKNDDDIEKLIKDAGMIHNKDTKEKVIKSISK